MTDDKLHSESEESDEFSESADYINDRGIQHSELAYCRHRRRHFLTATAAVLGAVLGT